MSSVVLEPRAPGILRGARDGCTALLLLVQLFDATATLVVPVAGATLLAAAWAADAARAAPRRVDLALAIFLAAYALAGAAGVDPARSFALTVPTVLPAFALYFASTRGDERTATFVAWAATAVVALISLRVVAAGLAAPGADPQRLADAAALTWLVVPNDIAAAICCLPVVWTRAARARGPVIVVSLLALAAAVLLRSRTALLAFGALLAVACWLATRHRAVRFGLVAAIAASVVALVVFVQKGTTSLDVRVGLWSAAWRTFLEHPWLGIGPHNFGMGALAADPRHMPWPHSLPLELAAEAGLLGLAAGLVALAALWGAARSAWQDGNRAIVSATLAAGAGFLVVAVLEASLLRLWVWMLLALLAGLLTRASLSKAAGR